MDAITIKDVHISYKTVKARSIKKSLFSLRKASLEKFEAVKGISFSIEQGEIVGLIGKNGSGKSTLLRSVANVFAPDSGTIDLHGNSVSLLSIGVGFQNDLTGKENIYLSGLLMGFTEQEIDEKYDEIVEFSELEEFLDVPLKNFSSGMKSRLGFAICTAVNPDILILDEVLSVGDARFRKKSEKRVMDMFEEGVTVLFVSHSLAQVKRICNKAMILDHGKMLAFGDIDEIAEQYAAFIEDKVPKKKKKLKKKKVVEDGGDGDKPAVQDADSSKETSANERRN